MFKHHIFIFGNLDMLPLKHCKKFVQTLLSSRSFLFTDMNGYHSRNLRILVEGNIASGKSTFLDLFKDHPQIETVPEPVEKWRNVDGINLLELFYSDQKRWSFLFQMHVLRSRLELHLRSVPRNKRLVLMERSAFSGHYCFAQNLFEQSVATTKLTKEEYVNLDEQFHHWITLIPATDYIVYLRTSPEVVHQRLAKRHRPEEAEIPVAYLESVHKSYENWLINEKFPLPLKQRENLKIIDADADIEILKEEYRNLIDDILQS